MRDWKPELLRAALLAAAIALLDVLFGVHNWAPFLEWARAPFPTLEALVLVGLLPLLRRSRRPTLAVICVSLAAAVPVALSVGEGIYQHAFREAFDPLTDARFLPALAEVAFGGDLFRIPVVAALIYAASFALLALPIVAILAVSRRAATPMAAGLAVGVSLAVALVFVASGSPAGAGFGRPAVALALRFFAPVSPAAAELPAVPAASAAGPAARTRDVHLLVVESYGATVFSNPDHRARLAGAYAALSERLREDGIGVRTALLDSPAFGGRSWIADATMATGIRVPDQAAYDTLAARSPVALSKVLSDRGYRTIFAAPGTLALDSTWGGIFPYHRRILYRDFGYAGPNMGFGVMPDQYTLAFVLRQEVLAPDRQPLFVHAVLVSSHTPWHTVPAYVEDWDGIGDGSLWKTPGQRTFYDSSLIGGAAYSPAYADSIAYVLRVVESYAARALGERGFAVVVGDHQPKYPVSERGATRSVVAHVLSRDAALLEFFAAQGWIEGLEAPEPARAVPLEGLYAELLGAPGVPTESSRDQTRR